MPAAIPDAPFVRDLRWPWSSLWGDLLRGGGGALITIFAALMNVPGSLWQICLLGLSAIFATLAAMALRKRMTRVALTQEGLKVEAPFAKPQALLWSALETFELRYFGGRSRYAGPSGGFMELALRAGRTRITFDDGIVGFRDILQASLAAARARDLGLSSVTETNLAYLLKGT